MSRSDAGKKLPSKVSNSFQYESDWEDARWRQSLRRRLLRWFRDHSRELPWRSEPTPYRVWVSEIMLQQTQVATVLPYFDRFLKAFPDIASLAAAEEQTLLGLWEGLGYYRRARSMHAAAKMIVEKHHGEFPETFDEVIALPGIGRYTAGAILSISRQTRLPILEGNTLRVFPRWIALRGAAPNDGPANRLLWEVAEQLLPRSRPGDFNQAAMELGALICTPTKPACESCPVADLCAAHIQGLQSEIPGKQSKMKYEKRTEFAFVLENPASDGATPTYLVRQIPNGRRWAGLWDFPRTTDETIRDIRQASTWLERDLGEPVIAGRRLTTIKHAVTRFRISLQVHEATLSDVADESLEPWQFCSLEQIQALPMSVTGRQIAELLESEVAKSDSDSTTT